MLVYNEKIKRDTCPENIDQDEMKLVFVNPSRKNKSALRKIKLH